MDKSVSVKIIDNKLLGEIPFCRVEDKIDTQESEDNDILTMIESIRDTEEHNRDRIPVCVTHRYGDKCICFPKNTPHCKTHPSAFCALAGVIAKEKDIGPVNRMIASDINNEGKNVSDSTVGANSDEFPPESILTTQHKLSRTIKRISLKIDT